MRICITLIGLTFCLTSAHSINADVFSTFDEDAEGWLLNTSTSELAWEPTGGNPDGHLQFTDMVMGAAFVIAPSPYHGDWGTLYEGGRLFFDHKIFEVGNGPLFNSSRVEISGPGGSAFYVGSKFAAEDWVTRSVPIVEANWDVAAGSWASLLADVTDLRIQIEGVSNDSPEDINGIDNIRLTAIPEPSSVTFLAISSILLLFRRRSRVESRFDGWIRPATSTGRAGP